MPSSVSSAWSQAWSDRAFRREFIVSLVILGLALHTLSVFLEIVEDRPGAILQDPIVSHIAPVFLTWLTFAIIYGGAVAGLVALLIAPRALLIVVQSYALMVVIRMAMMYLMPLDPPPGLIPLADPFVQFFGSGRVPTRDLFFSGHTSTLFLYFLGVPQRGWKVFFLVCTAIVAAAVLWQHVHYSIDVVVAPFVAYASYRATTVWHAWRSTSSNSSVERTHD